MSIATLTSKGQTTIPKDVRDFLKIDSGDRIEFIFNPDGSVLLRPATLDVKNLKGSLKSFSKKSTVSIEDMNHAIKVKFARRS